MKTPAIFSLTRRALGAAFLAGAACGFAGAAEPVSVSKTIAAEASLSTLNSLIIAADLQDALDGAGPFTVFAPSNDALKALPAAVLNDVSKDPAKLKNLLTFHVVPAAAMAKDVKNSNVKALNGDTLALSKAGEFVTVENAMVIKADIAASNGVVHIIDTVLIPPVKK
ncbi:MAG: fasciclin domain-containing protein [Betaproteobacteria bacterium]|nr:fasciclin domain-containing protein [Betaproteobacteria bacterium]